jgi:RNA polymerase sigma-70 factor (ECF subfamily)
MATLASDWVKTREDGAASFERLFLREYGKVTAIAFRVLGDAHEAEDVAQEVFCSFYRQHAPDAPYAGGWLYRAAVHTALNVIRGKRRREKREAVVSSQQLAVGNGGGPDPAMAVVQEEQRREVRLALGRLPEKSAAVLALRYGGLSYAEVAESLGVKTGQVGTMLRRAEAALRKELDHGARG